MSAHTSPAIAADGLTKIYGSKRAVDLLDLEVERGEIFGLLGPNGAGKTTTILMMLGLTEPTTGTARVFGLDPARESLAVKRMVGYLPDDVGFYENLTARENLRYTARLNRLSEHVADRRIEAVLGQVDLLADADRRVGGYSRGMRQRLGVADALVKEPQLLILDEPTVNIDPEGVRQLLGVVESLRDERGVTVVLSSHLLGQVQQICDRIGIFVDGRLVGLGSVDELASEAGLVIGVGIEDRTADLTEVLAPLGPVSHVEGGHGTWTITADHDCRAEIADAIHDAGLGLNNLELRRQSLDEIYHRYFTRGDDDDHD